MDSVYTFLFIEGGTPSMISIFNGKTRGFGGVKDDIYVQVSVSMRQYIHLFKGAPFAVFMVIALHADRDGFAFPSIPMLCKETGYTKDTVFKALNELRALTIKGRRVLCSVQRETELGKFATNGYLVFPSEDEAKAYDEGKAARDANHVGVTKSKSINNAIPSHRLSLRVPNSAQNIVQNNGFESGSTS